MLPPPTTITGRGSAEIRAFSTQSSSMKAIRSRARRISPRSRPETLAASPSVAPPSATTISVVVSVLPPKIRASVEIR